MAILNSYHCKACNTDFYVAKKWDKETNEFIIEKNPICPNCTSKETFANLWDGAGAVSQGKSGNADNGYTHSMVGYQYSNFGRTHKLKGKRIK